MKISNKATHVGWLFVYYLCENIYMLKSSQLH